MANSWVPQAQLADKNLIDIIIIIIILLSSLLLYTSGSNNDKLIASSIGLRRTRAIGPNVYVEQSCTR